MPQGEQEKKLVAKQGESYVLAMAFVLSTILLSAAFFLAKIHQGMGKKPKCVNSIISVKSCRLSLQMHFAPFGRTSVYE